MTTTAERVIDGLLADLATGIEKRPGRTVSIKRCRYGYHDVVDAVTGERLMTAFDCADQARRWAIWRGMVPVLSDEETQTAIARIVQGVV